MHIFTVFTQRLLPSHAHASRLTPRASRLSIPPTACQACFLVCVSRPTAIRNTRTHDRHTTYRRYDATQPQHTPVASYQWLLVPAWPALPTEYIRVYLLPLVALLGPSA